jgi:hypothetical protein
LRDPLGVVEEFLALALAGEDQRRSIPIYFFLPADGDGGARGGVADRLAGADDVGGVGVGLDLGLA